MSGGIVSSDDEDDEDELIIPESVSIVPETIMLLSTPHIMTPIVSRAPTPVPQVRVLSLPAEPSPLVKVLKTTQPRTLGTSSSHKRNKPTDIPEFEFFTEKMALSQLNERDFYESTDFWRTKCTRLHERTPRLIPPEIRDNESPKMAKFKYEQFYKKCAAVQSAMQFAIIFYIIVAGIEILLRWFNIKAQGLFTTIYNNREEHYDALLEMGEATLGWFNGTQSPLIRMVIGLVVSVVILIATNYIAAFLPSGFETLVDSYKGGALKWLQDLLSVFLGTKKINPEAHSDGYGDKILDMLKGFIGGGSDKANNTMHDD